MSKKIKERTKQLASREKELKKDLLGKSSTTSKKSKIAKTVLAGGSIALILYIVYRFFIQENKKPKKNKKAKSASGAIQKKLLALVLPYLGELIVGFISKQKESKNQEKTEEKDKS